MNITQCEIKHVVNTSCYYMAISIIFVIFSGLNSEQMATPGALLSSRGGDVILYRVLKQIVVFIDTVLAKFTKPLSLMRRLGANPDRL